GHASAEDPYVAFDTAAEHVAKRLRRYKRRLTDHHKARGGDTVEEVPDLRAQHYVLADDASVEETPAEDDVPVIIAESATEILALTVSEAVMRMNFAELPALVFRNKAHGRLNAVYRRADGNIGWVDPENPTTSAAR
ncbi:MAG: sigma 54 modulation/S30EA ribosomal C-terminal domain-containing protein, partial [Alphaproteobacteria bacterium]